MRMKSGCLSVISTLLCVGSTGPVAAPPPPAAAPAPDCQPGPAAWSGNGPYDTKRYGNYYVSNDNFNGTPGQKMWATAERCFGVTTTSTAERSTVGSYPHVVRGWMQNDADMRSGSAPGTLDWTSRSGLGIPVLRLAKARIHWAFSAPTDPGSRWNALVDVYLHRTASPAPSEFPPAFDIQIFQAIADQVINDTTYFAYMAARDHATTVTLGGTRYLLIIDDPGGSGFHQAGGHTIALFALPTSFTSRNNLARWGSVDAVTDVSAIINYFLRPAPLDDRGQPILSASGAPITAPLISTDLYLTAINAGWEIDVGRSFTTTAFCVAMQNEPDCL